MKTKIETLNLGIKKHQDDAVCIRIPDNSSVAVVMTKNKFAAAPVQLTKTNIKKSTPKYLLINSGNANACTGATGLLNANKCCIAISKKLSCKPTEVLLYSTGIIGKQLPIKKILSSIMNHDFKFTNQWIPASKSIMTTDKFHKHIKRSFYINKCKITIQAICKGAGMIEPNMATMLAFIDIDVNLSKTITSKLLKHCVDLSFNRISVDGDMSTNDCVTLIASGSKSSPTFKPVKTDLLKIQQHLLIVCKDLSAMIIKDGEGSTKSIQTNICNAKNSDEARKIAYALVNSTLVKTAIYGCDPNWGRIAAKLGSIFDATYNPNKIVIKINNIIVYKNGIEPVNLNLTKLKSSMKKSTINITIDLKSGSASYDILASDITEEYIHLNSAYPS